MSFACIPLARLMPARIDPSLYQPAADRSTVDHVKFTVESLRPGRGGVLASVVSGDVGFQVGIPDGLPVKIGDKLVAEFPKGVSSLIGPYSAIYPASQKPKEQTMNEKRDLFDIDLSLGEKPALPVPATEPLTMSSLEIAELVQSRHDNVKRTVERLAESEVIRLPPMGEIERINNLGLPAKTKVYQLCKRDSLVVVARLSPEFTARVVDRWQELEAKIAASAIPQTLPEALRLAADLAEQKAKAEAALALAAPKVAALERIAADEKSLTLTQTAKVLGVKRESLIRRLHAEGWIYRQNSSWLARSAAIKAGRLVYKEAHFTNEKTGLEEAKPYCHLTPKGLTHVAEMLGKPLPT